MNIIAELNSSKFLELIFCNNFFILNFSKMRVMKVIGDFPPISPKGLVLVAQDFCEDFAN